MATTYLQAVNSVLRRLREREVASVDNNKYSALIGELVSDAVKEVEGYWDWMGLRDSVILETVAGTFRYEFNDVPPTSKLLYDTYGRPTVFNDTEDYHLHKAPSSRWMSTRLNDGDDNGKPTHFDFVGVHQGELLVDLWPIPDAEYRLVFDMIVPQGDMVDSDIIRVPAQPVILLAWSKAVYERGEDQGYLSDLAYRQFEQSLSSAISMDMANTSDNLTWHPV